MLSTTQCTADDARMPDTTVAHARTLLPRARAHATAAGDVLLCEPDASREAALCQLRVGCRRILCGDEAVGGN